MDVSEELPTGLGAGTPAADPRLQPTPDYGTLGPGSDIPGVGPIQAQQAGSRSQLRSAHLVAALIGMAAALIAGTMSKALPIWRKAAPSRPTHSSLARDARQLDRMKPQTQAETLLEMAVGHSQGAVEQISSRAGEWKGKVQWSPQIVSLTTAALNSNDMRVRESGVEVELAAYGLSKNSASLEYLLNTLDSPDHSQKVWALWALGLMANRGVEPGRIVEVLAAHLKNDDDDSRRWAAEALALSGSDEAIQQLLTAMHDDRSPLVRERAACGLASSGMFSPQQWMMAVPQLLSYTDDPSIDAQTRGWAFQALGDITHQRLGNSSAEWRRWYAGAGVSQ